MYSLRSSTDPKTAPGGLPFAIVACACPDSRIRIYRDRRRRSDVFPIASRAAVIPFIAAGNPA